VAFVLQVQMLRYLQAFDAGKPHFKKISW
jgi:hypothetical protein